MSRRGSPAGSAGPAEPATGLRRVHLAVEFLLVFVGVPLAVRGGWLPLHPFLLLWMGAGLCLAALLTDGAHARIELWAAEGLRRSWRPITVRFAAVVVVMGVLAWSWTPERLFAFVRERPGMWAVVMVLYPVLSVYPQGIIYRAFLLHRYRPLMPHRLGRIALSAGAFGFMHIVFENAVAVALTVLGGAVFAATHESSRSLAASSFEHTLYGWLVFTVGWGWWFVLS